ncbi:MAG: tyrosine--tRNA ligase, partial [Clostridia bacterium]|nr:tyrosine--tRNA ligase [Clostridia bacterium]
TSPYDFYQYWRNVGDSDVIKCIRMLTFLPLEKIDEMATWEGSKLNEAKEILAYELTMMVHGKDEADKAQASAKALFASGADADIPTVEITAADLIDGAADILTLLVKSGLVPSRSEARRSVEQGGVTVDNEKITDTRKAYTEAELKGGVVIRKGKKSYMKVILK